MSSGVISGSIIQAKYEIGKSVWRHGKGFRVQNCVGLYVTIDEPGFNLKNKLVFLQKTLFKYRLDQ